MSAGQVRTGERPKVVVVGGGFGGVAAVQKLRKADVDVLLVDRHVYNMFQPLLYQVATAGLNPGDVTYFLRALRYKQDNVNFRQGLLAKVDADNQRITLKDGEEIDYDFLVLANGVTTNFLHTPGAKQHSRAIYTRSQALAIRDELFLHLEQAAASPEETDGLRVVIVGGGATGVEMAGALAELRNQGLTRAYPEIPKGHIEITLVQRGHELIKPFAPKLRKYARNALDQRGVILRLGSGVKEVMADGVLLTDGTIVPADVVVWAAGVKAHDEVAAWGFEQGWGGRIVVDDDMRVKGRSNVFAVGDIALSESDLPQLAQPALQSGKHAGAQILRILAGKPTQAFKYLDKGTMATIGRNAAVTQIPHLPGFTGWFAWYMWAGVHVFQLLGGRNRLSTFANLASRYGQFWYDEPIPIIGEIRPVRLHGDRDPEPVTDDGPSAEAQAAPLADPATASGPTSADDEQSRSDEQSRPDDHGHDDDQSHAESTADAASPAPSDPAAV